MTAPLTPLSEKRLDIFDIQIEEAERHGDAVIGISLKELRPLIAAARRAEKADELIRTVPMASYIKFGMSEPGTRAYILAEERIDKYESKRTLFLSEASR